MSCLTCVDSMLGILCTRVFYERVSRVLLFGAWLFT